MYGTNAFSLESGKSRSGFFFGRVLGLAEVPLGGFLSGLNAENPSVCHARRGNLLQRISSYDDLITKCYQLLQVFATYTKASITVRKIGVLPQTAQNRCIWRFSTLSAPSIPEASLTALRERL